MHRPLFVAQLDKCSPALCDLHRRELPLVAAALVETDDGTCVAGSAVPEANTCQLDRMGGRRLSGHFGGQVSSESFGRLIIFVNICINHHTSIMQAQQ